MLDWPEWAGYYLINSDVVVFIVYDTNGRVFELMANNDWGNRIMTALNL
jgi:hypothetical protein